MLLIQGDAHTHTPPLGGCCCLASALDKQTVSLCALQLTVLLPYQDALYLLLQSASGKRSCSQQGQQSGPLCFQPPAALVTRTPGFHTGCPGSIPERRTKIPFRAITHCCLSEISGRQTLFSQHVVLLSGISTGLLVNKF